MKIAISKSEKTTIHKSEKPAVDRLEKQPLKSMKTTANKFEEKLLTSQNNSR